MIRKTKYPEHEKLHAIKDQSQACYDFIEHLRRYGYTLCIEHRHDESCRADGERICDLRDGEFIPAPMNLRKTLADFFGINEEALEAEKRVMLANLSQGQGEDPTARRKQHG